MKIFCKWNAINAEEVRKVLAKAPIPLEGIYPMMTQTKGGKQGMGYTATSNLKPVQDGTKLTLVLDIEPGYGLLGKAIYGLLRSTEEKCSEEH